MAEQHLKIACEIDQPVVVTTKRVHLVLRHRSLAKEAVFEAQFWLFPDFTPEHWSKLKKGEIVDLELTWFDANQLLTAPAGGAVTLPVKPKSKTYLNINVAGATVRLAGDLKKTA